MKIRLYLEISQLDCLDNLSFKFLLQVQKLMHQLIHSQSGVQLDLYMFLGPDRSLVTTTSSEGHDPATICSPSLDIAPRQKKGPGKRTLSDMLNLIPSLHFLEVNKRSSKRRKLRESSHIQ